MTLKPKDIPVLFYPWHSLSEVQDELQKDFIWQITKQQDSGSPQVVQTESLRSQFKTSTLNKEGVKLEGIILSCLQWDLVQRYIWPPVEGFWMEGQHHVPLQKIWILFHTRIGAHQHIKDSLLH